MPAPGGTFYVNRIGGWFETFDEASVQKIVEMRAAGHRVTIGFRRTAPDHLLEAYPALGEAQS